MSRATPPKTIRAFLVLLAACTLAGCGEGKTKDPEPRYGSPSLDLDGLDGEDDVALDLGEDWDAVTGRATRSTVADVDELDWAVVLEAYAQPGHEQAAHNMIRNLPRIAPQIAGARVHRTESGSMVVYGRYADPTDPAAREDLERIKSITFGNPPRPVFQRAMLTHLEPPAGARPRDPHALMSARARLPNVDPLYSLQVGVWGAFDSEISPAEVRQRGEAHVRQLRAQGFEAYYHHDRKRDLTTVTVGLFDHRAIDPQSGIMSFEVEQLLKQFPAHLVNGAELREPIDARHPDQGTRLQRPRLVLVPD